MFAAENAILDGWEIQAFNSCYFFSQGIGWDWCFEGTEFISHWKTGFVLIFQPCQSKFGKRCVGVGQVTMQTERISWLLVVIILLNRCLRMLANHSASLTSCKPCRLRSLISQTDNWILLAASSRSSNSGVPIASTSRTKTRCRGRWGLIKCSFLAILFSNWRMHQSLIAILFSNWQLGTA